MNDRWIGASSVDMWRISASNDRSQRSAAWDGAQRPYRCATRAPFTCARCRNHRLKVQLKGHKRYCQYRYCMCDRCRNTTTRRRLQAMDMMLRREKAQNEARIAAGEPHPSVVPEMLDPLNLVLTPGHLDLAMKTPDHLDLMVMPEPLELENVQIDEDGRGEAARFFSSFME